MTKALRRAIAVVANEIAHKKIEHGVVLDLDGTEIWRGRGTATKVAIPGELVANRVVVHNHPSSSWFSAEDLNYAWCYNVALMVVTSPRYTYLLERPCTGWPQSLVLAYRDLSKKGSTDFHRLLVGAAAVHKFYYRRFPRAAEGVTFVVATNGIVEEAWK